jgi:hypothetical protein
MNRKTFLKAAACLLAVPFIGKAESKTPEPKYDRMKLSHQYPGAYHEPNDLWTPEEITEAGFVFVPLPSCIHRFDDPWHPIMKSYCNHDSNLRPIVMKSRMCGPSYIKTYDLDAGRRRGIESLPDYFRKKEIFKPMILEFMKKQEFHYVHRVLLGTSPCSWNGTFGDGPMIYHLYPVFVRGARLPKKI